MYCCLCQSLDELNYKKCRYCNRVFCVECIEIENMQKLELLSKNNICVFCRIQNIKKCSEIE